MNEFEKAIALAIDKALAEADALYLPQIETLKDDILAMQGKVLAFSLVAENLARTATETDRTSAAAQLDIAAENWPASEAGLAGFAGAHETLRALLLRS